MPALITPKPGPASPVPVPPGLLPSQDVALGTDLETRKLSLALVKSPGAEEPLDSSVPPAERSAGAFLDKAGVGGCRVDLN